MDNRIAVVAVMVSDNNSVERVNSVLHDFNSYIIGRLGIPYKQKGICVITLVIDAPQEIINSLSGKLGMTEGVTSKVMLTK